MLTRSVSSDGSNANSETLEQYFSKAQADCVDAATAVRSLQRTLSRLEKALGGGDVAAISKARDEIGAARDSLEQKLAKVASFSTVSVESVFRSEPYFKEIADLATSRGVSGVRSTEGRLFSYPYVIERKKVGIALSVGTRATKNVRPSAVIQTLSEARKRGSRFTPQALLDAVESAYELKRRSQPTDMVAIDEIHEILTTLPDSAKEYPLLDFLANLDELKRSGLLTSKTRRALDLPPPSTAGKGGKGFRVIREDGREQWYRMLRFVGAGETRA